MRRAITFLGLGWWGLDSNLGSGGSQISREKRTPDVTRQGLYFKKNEQKIVYIASNVVFP